VSLKRHYAVVIEWKPVNALHYQQEAWTEVIRGFTYPEAQQVESEIRKHWRGRFESVRICNGSAVRRLELAQPKGGDQ
jgi:hypothetical protein